MTKTYLYIVLLISAALLGSCRSAQPASEPVVADEPQPVAVSAAPADYIPRAVVYRTNGPWNECVMVTLSPSRDALVSYPAPTDVNVNSAPVVLKDGWLLDRRGGVSTNSAFLRITYAEYAALPQAPAPDSIMSMVNPDARVTEVKRLPITASEAIENPSAVLKYLD